MEVIEHELGGLTHQIVVSSTVNGHVFLHEEASTMRVSWAWRLPHGLNFADLEVNFGISLHVGRVTFVVANTDILFFIGSSIWLDKPQIVVDPLLLIDSTEYQASIFKLFII